jgi:hypothetical protein
MFLKTKLKPKPVIQVLVFLGLCAIGAAVAFKFDYTIGLIAAITVLALAVLIALTGFPSKLNSVTFYNDYLEVKNFWGIGEPKQYKYADIKGYVVTFQLDGNKNLEQYELQFTDGKTALVSSAFHDNYQEIAIFLIEKGLKEIADPMRNMIERMDDDFAGRKLF